MGVKAIKIYINAGSNYNSLSIKLHDRQVYR
jgi:hypothetical protein